MRYIYYETHWICVVSGCKVYIYIYIRRLIDQYFISNEVASYFLLHPLLIFWNLSHCVICHKIGWKVVIFMKRPRLQCLNWKNFAYKMKLWPLTVGLSKNKNIEFKSLVNFSTLAFCKNPTRVIKLDRLSK